MNKTKVSISSLESKLKSKGFNTVVLNNDKEVKDFINTNIPDEMQVGLGDSITTCKLNIRNILFAKGTKIFYSWNGSENYNRSIDTYDDHIRPDYYITRIAALTTDGRILMPDYEKEAAQKNDFPINVYAFVGVNRIVEEFEQIESIDKYPIIDTNPENSNFTVAILPFLDY